MNSVVLFLIALGLLAASPQLHAALHPDADHEDHSCAITLFSHGVDDGAAPAVVVLDPSVRLEALVAPSASRLVTAPNHWLPPGRAPPVR